MEEDIVYSDDDDDDDDRYYQRRAANRTLEPHPQIKQLTDEVLPFYCTCWEMKQGTISLVFVSGL